LAGTIEHWGKEYVEKKGRVRKGGGTWGGAPSEVV